MLLWSGPYCQMTPNRNQQRGGTPQPSFRAAVSCKTLFNFDASNLIPAAFQPVTASELDRKISPVASPFGINPCKVRSSVSRKKRQFPLLVFQPNNVTHPPAAPHVAASVVMRTCWKSFQIPRVKSMRTPRRGLIQSRVEPTTLNTSTPKKFGL